MHIAKFIQRQQQQRKRANHTKKPTADWMTTINQRKWPLSRSKCNWNRTLCCDDTIYESSCRKNCSAASIFAGFEANFTFAKLQFAFKYDDSTNLYEVYDFTAFYCCCCCCCFFFFFLFGFAPLSLSVFLRFLFGPIVHCTVNTISLFSRYKCPLLSASRSHTCDNLEFHVTLPFILVDRSCCWAWAMWLRVVV